MPALASGASVASAPGARFRSIEPRLIIVLGRVPDRRHPHTVRVLRVGPALVADGERQAGKAAALCLHGGSWTPVLLRSPTDAGISVAATMDGPHPMPFQNHQGELLPRELAPGAAILFAIIDLYCNCYVISFLAKELP